MVSCVNEMACHVMELILNMLFAFAMALSEHHYFHIFIQYDAIAQVLDTRFEYIIIIVL